MLPTPPKLFADDIFNLADIARDVALAFPDRLAVIEPDGHESGKRRYKRHTYRELSSDAESVAVGLREMEIGEGTRIVCMTPPSYDTAVIALALSRVGATTVWIDPSVGYHKVGERLRRVSPDGFAGVTLAHLGRAAFGWGPRFPKKAIVAGGPPFPGARTIASLRRTAPSNPAKPAVSPDDPAIILFTTGSTGPAKPAFYSHRSMTALCRVVHESWGFAGDESASEAPQPPVDISLFPAFFFIPLSAGGTLVVPPIHFARETPATADARAILEVINDCNVSSCFGSPVLLENIARHARENGIATPSLRRVIGGGAPIVADVKRQLLALVGPHGKVFANYGATEAMPSTGIEARETLNETWAQTRIGKGLCVGKPFSNIELRVVPICDGVMPSLPDALPTGAIGEILVRGPHVSTMYFLDEESTRKNKTYGVPSSQEPNGEIWHRFGDAGHLDEQGRLWYCGRVSQRVVIADGSSLFPLTCEPIFDAHPAVKRSGLVGRGTTPVICVELVDGTPKDRETRERIRRELLELAAAHPTTRAIATSGHVLFPKRLPVDPRHNSKIERPALTKWAVSQMASNA